METNRTEFAGIGEKAILALLSEPHVFDEAIVAFGESSFALAACRCGRFIVGLDDIAAFEKISSQWWCVGEGLECGIHVACISDILQAN